MYTANKNTNLLNDELQAFQDLAIDFAAKELEEQREENDRHPFSPLNMDTIRKAGEVGFYGINLPADFGGVQMGVSALAVVMENLSMVDASMAGVIFTNAAALEIIKEASMDSDCSHIYQRLSEAGFPVAFQSYAGPEEVEMPLAGEENGKVIVSGKIDYLVLGGITGLAVISARLKDEDGFSCYLIDLNSAGVEKSETVLSLGLNSCPAIDVKLNRVEAELIGTSGEGGKYFDSMQVTMSTAAAAISLGLMKGSFDEALPYTRDRFQGGRQIIDWPELRMIMANMSVHISVGECCISHACMLADSGSPAFKGSSIASAIHVSEMACLVTTDGVQLLGGNGYMKDYGQEKRMRDAKQVQSLLGMAPLRKMKFIEGIIQETE